MALLPRWDSGGNGDHTQWAARAANDLERRSDDYSASGRQQFQIHQAGDAKFARAVHNGVVREGWGEGACLASIGSDGFYTDAQDVAFLCQEF